MGPAQQTFKVSRLPRVWYYPEDETDDRGCCLNKPEFMIPPEGDTCPANNLPLELLSHIFQIGGTDGHSASHAEHEEGNKNAPIAGDEEVIRRHVYLDSVEPSLTSRFRISVSLVSRCWHDVAVATPSLWTTINVPSEFHTLGMHLQSLLLKRSCCLPIDIDLGEDCRPDVYLLLVPHVDRWRSVKAEFRSYKDMDAFFHAVSRPTVSAASRLTTLQLYVGCSYCRNSSPPGDLTLFGGSAPYLERMALCDVSINWGQPWISSASNLTYFEFKCDTDNFFPSWAQFATVLRGAPALRTLKLYVSAMTRGPSDWYITSHAGNAASDPYRPIHLLNLTDFFVALHSQGDPTGLFRKLHMPSLTSLALDIPYVTQPDLVEYLAFPSPSLASPSLDNAPPNVLNQLEDLIIINSPCSWHAIEMFYSELRNLRSLHIVLGHGCWRRDVPMCLSALVAWLPRLEKLYVSRAAGKLTDIRHVVESCRKIGVTLKVLYLKEWCGMNDETSSANHCFWHSGTQ